MQVEVIKRISNGSSPPFFCAATVRQSQGMTEKKKNIISPDMLSSRGEILQVVVNRTIKITQTLKRGNEAPEGQHNKRPLITISSER